MKSSPKKIKKQSQGFKFISLLGLLYKLKILTENKMRMVDEYRLSAIRDFTEKYSPWIDDE